MVTPKTPESIWLDYLRCASAFIPGEQRLIVVSPHPDDETLGVGGLIALQSERGIASTVIAVTDGENAYSDTPGLGEVRTQEQARAVQILGGDQVQLVRLGFTDRAVAEREDDLADALSKFITADTHVIAPWTGDFHPDHEACGRAAAQVAKSAGARLSWYFFWTWHRGDPAVLDGLQLARLHLSDGQRKQKWDALQEHASQLSHPSGKPILPQYLLAPAQRNFEVFADAW